MTTQNDLIQLEQDLLEFYQTNEKDRQDNDKLNKVIEIIAVHGITTFSWTHLKVLLQFKIKQLCLNSNLSDEYQQIAQNLLNELERRNNGAPFTLQRICELLYTPKRNYTRLERLLAALQTCLNVPSCVSDFKETVSSSGEQMDIEDSF